MFTREVIEKLLSDLNSKLKARGLQGELCIFGGAAMILNFNARMATKDVDAIFAPKAEFHQCVQEVAEDNGLSNDWLNDGVKGFLVDNFKQDQILNFSHLRVYTPEPEFLLSMKAISARIDSMDAQDLVTLIRHLGIKNVNQVIDILSKYYPHTQVNPKTQFFLEELFDKL